MKLEDNIIHSFPMDAVMVLVIKVNQTSSIVKIMFLKVKNLFLLLSVLTLVVLTNTVMFVLMLLLPIVSMMEPLQSNASNVIVNRTISIL
jgi:hypothetical protein